MLIDFKRYMKKLLMIFMFNEFIQRIKLNFLNRETSANHPLQFIYNSVFAKAYQLNLLALIPLPIEDASACGLAPVTTTTQGPMEIVPDGHNGILVPPRDSQAIEQALERLILDRPYLEQLRRNAYATAQHYSWERIARNNLAFYEEALSQRKYSRNSI